MSAVIKRSIDEKRFADMVRDTAFLVERIRRERNQEAMEPEALI
jgi:hypothetical protein